MGMPGMGELLVILVIVMLVFGANKLPALGDGIGKAIRNLKRGLHHDDDVDATVAAPRLAADPGAARLEDGHAKALRLSAGAAEDVAER